MVIQHVRLYFGIGKQKQEDEKNEFVDVEEFRDLVSDLQLPQNEDQYLLRWLRARDFDLTKAEKMLRNHVEWRKKWKVDELTDDWKPLEVLSKYYGVGLLGEDSTGNPVWLIRHGNLDIRGVLRSVTPKEFIRHTIWILEKSMRFMYRQTQKLGRDITRQSIIFDLENWKFRDLAYKPGMDLALELVKFYEANYPEILGHTFVINAPKFFQIAFSLIKPLLTETTLSKIRIFGSDRATWSKAILEVVPAEVLPKKLGGIAVDADGDEWCTSKVPAAGEVPKSYYRDTKQQPIPNAITITVGSGAVSMVEQEVKEGATVRWQFRSEGGDIGFGISRKLSDGSLVEVTPKDRIASHEDTEEGEVTCTASGTYVIEFDNSYSYVRSKTVHYALSVFN